MGWIWGFCATFLHMHDWVRWAEPSLGRLSDLIFGRSTSYFTDIIEHSSLRHNLGVGGGAESLVSWFCLGPLLLYPFKQRPTPYNSRYGYLLFSKGGSTCVSTQNGHNVLSGRRKRFPSCTWNTDRKRHIYVNPQGTRRSMEIDVHRLWPHTHILCFLSSDTPLAPHTSRSLDPPFRNIPKSKTTSLGLGSSFRKSMSLWLSFPSLLIEKSSFFLA